MPSRRLRTLAAGLAIALTLPGLGACGSTADEAARGGSVSGDSLTIYSSLPLRGPFAERMRAIVGGEKLALSEAGGRVADWTVKYASLDDAADSNGWDASTTADNARAAATDPSAIAYLGDADFGATAISLPILNEAGVAQVSPASTYTGFTSSTDATVKGEPEKYQPSGVPTFARVIPADDVQGRAQAAYQRVAGCRRTAVLDDGGVEGRSLAVAVAAALPQAGVRAVAPQSIDLGGDAPALAADCVFLGAGPDADPVAMLTALHAQLPAAQIFLPADLAQPALLGRVPAAAQVALRLTQPTLPRSRAGGAARAVLARYQRTFGEPAPYEMLYGYEAMRVVLDALRRAGDRANERTYVGELIRGSRHPTSALGPFAIQRSGDTTLETFSGYRVVGGRPVFDRVVLGG